MTTTTPMSYLIATEIKGVPHAIATNVEENKFELIPIRKDSEISKAFCAPHQTGAYNILQWINKNDKKLASKSLTVQPEAKFFY
jgi:hypothetical protein